MTARQYPIEAGHIMTFARAVGDPNPIYHDVEYARSTEIGEIIAPPTFVHGSNHYDPDWHLRPHIGQSWFGAESAPSDDSDTKSTRANTMHAEQHYEYFRPICAGELLDVHSHAGRSWQKHGRRGTLHFTETITDYRGKDGELVATARLVAVRIDSLASSSSSDTGEEPS